MSKYISRRRLLQSTAAAGTATALAGCSSLNPLSSGGSACGAGEDFISAMADEDAEALADMSPYEYVEGQDRADFVEAYEMMFQFTGTGEVEISDVSCECSESVDEDEAMDEEEGFDADISEVQELRYEIAMEADGESHTDSEYMYAVKIDGDWYVGLADGQEMDHC